MNTVDSLEVVRGILAAGTLRYEAGGEGLTIEELGSIYRCYPRILPTEREQLAVLSALLINRRAPGWILLAHLNENPPSAVASRADACGTGQA
jgi:hypothetical protein